MVDLFADSAAAAAVVAAAVAAAVVTAAVVTAAVAPAAAAAAGEQNDQDNDDPKATIVSAHILNSLSPHLAIFVSFRCIRGAVEYVHNRYLRIGAALICRRFL